MDLFSTILKPVCLTSLCVGVYTAECRAEKPMNVLFLLVDDIRWNSIGCLGNQIIMTPNVDQLAKEGVRFNRACVTTAICMVSRASILTGQYMSCHKIGDFGKPIPEQAFTSTYPAVLRKAGYWTGYVGKYGVGNIRESDFDFCITYEGIHWYKDQNGDSIQVTMRNEADALRFIDERPKEKPFLLSVGFFAVHAEDNNPNQYLYRPESEEYYSDIEIPVPKTATWEHFRALPPFLATEENEGRQRWHWRFDTPEKYQRYMKSYYRMITEVDQTIGKIVNKLKEQGVYENTLIIVMGDNGYFHAEHGLADKWYPYEESVRVPLVVYDPRLSADNRNLKVDELVLNIDIAPSIISAVGARVPEDIQGVDFSRLYLDKKKPSWRKDFFYEHPVVINERRIPASEAVITANDKYILWPTQEYEEYFDLRKDPFEEKNSVKEKKYLKRINILRTRLKELRLEASGKP